MNPIFGLINLPTADDDSDCDVFVGPITRTSSCRCQYLKHSCNRYGNTPISDILRNALVNHV